MRSAFLNDPVTAGSFNLRTISPIDDQILVVVVSAFVGSYPLAILNYKLYAMIIFCSLTGISREPVAG